MSENDNKELQAQDDSELAVEIVDDTPEADKGRPTKVDVKEVSEDEMDNYSENVKKRFSQLTAKYHAERRSKEAIERENQEAIAYAQKVSEENNRLAKLVAESQKNLANAAKLKAESEVERAKAFYKQAYEAGDADKIVEAQETMARAVAEQENWKNFRPVEPEEKSQYQAPQRPKVDPKAAEWANNNKWFGVDKEMTGTAYGIHERLVRDEKMDPTSDEYYQTIDSEMRKRYPDRFEDQEELPTEQPSRQKVQKVSAVAPVSRSVKQPRKVTLTTTQVSLAKRLGITPEQYAAQIAKEMQNG
jgi:hypothetical protein